MKRPLTLDEVRREPVKPDQPDTRPPVALPVQDIEVLPPPPVVSAPRQEPRVTGAVQRAADRLQEPRKPPPAAPQAPPQPKPAQADRSRPLTLSEVREGSGQPLTLAEVRGESKPADKASEAGFFGSAAKGLMSGIMGVEQAVGGTFLRYVGDKTGIDEISRAGKSVEKFFEAGLKQYEADASLQGSIVDDPGLLKKPAWWAYNVSNMLPSFAASIVPGAGAANVVSKAGKIKNFGNAIAKTVKNGDDLAGFVKIGTGAGAKLIKNTPDVAAKMARIGKASRAAGAVAGGLTGGMLEGAHTYRETYDLVKDNGGSEAEASQAATLAFEQMTAASGLLNSLSVGRFLRNPEVKSKIGEVGQRTISALTEGLTEYLEGPAEAGILINQELISPEEAVKRIKDELNVVPPSMVIGFLVPGLGGNLATVEQGKKNAEPDKPVDVSKMPDVDADAGPAGRAVNVMDEKVSKKVQADIKAEEEAKKPATAKPAKTEARKAKPATPTKKKVTPAKAAPEKKDVTKKPAKKQAVKKKSVKDDEVVTELPELVPEEPAPTEFDKELEKFEAERGKEDQLVKEAAKQGDVKPVADAIEGKDTSKQALDKLEDVQTGVADTIDPAESLADIRNQANEAATSPKNDKAQPNDLQKKKGAYEKGPLNLEHVPAVLIENPAGSKRSGKGADGKKWSREMKGVHYGYFPKSEGADNENDGTPTEGVDVMIKDSKSATDPELPIFVVDQQNEDGSFDEHKVLVGFKTEEAAKQGYLDQYEKGWTGLQSITELDNKEFNRWLKDPKQTGKPAADSIGEQREADDAAKFVAKLRKTGNPKDAITADVEEQHESWRIKAIDAKTKPLKKEITADNARIDDLAGQGDKRAFDLAVEHDWWTNWGKDKTGRQGGGWKPQPIIIKTSQPATEGGKKSNKWGEIQSWQNYNGGDISVQVAGHSRSVSPDSLTFQTPKDKARFQRIVGVYEKSRAPTKGEPTPGAQHDVRLKREPFRNKLKAMSDELIKGGGVTYIRDENDRIIKRTKSQNPEWFQNMAAEPATKVNTKQVSRMVDKALAGEKLGVREERVLQVMLDQQSDERGTQVDFAKQQLDEARAQRNEIRENAGLPADPFADVAGELFVEEEYDAEQTAESRIILELATQANEAGVTEAEIERLAIRFPDDAQYISALEETINGRRDQNGAQEVQVESQEEAQAVTPRVADQSGETGDIFGEDTRTTQGLADEVAARDAKRNAGQESLETGDPTDLFSEASKQTDIEDVAKKKPIPGLAAEARERKERTETIVKRAPNFAEEGEYDVTLPSGNKLKIYRDPESGYWLKVGKESFRNENLIGFTRKEAIAKLESQDANLKTSGTEQSGADTSLAPADQTTAGAQPQQPATDGTETTTGQPESAPRIATAPDDVVVSAEPAKSVGKGMKKQEVFTTLFEPMKRFQNIAKINVAETADELPTHIPKHAVGAWTSGKNEIWLVADKLKDAKHAEQILVHELFGHKTVEQLPNFKEIVSAVDGAIGENGDKVLKQLSSEVFRTHPDVSSDIHAREVIARLAQTTDHDSLSAGAKRVIGQIKKSLSDMGFKTKFSDADLLRHINEGAKRATARAESIAFLAPDKDSDEFKTFRDSPDISAFENAKTDKQREKLLNKMATSQDESLLSTSEPSVQPPDDIRAEFTEKMGTPTREQPLRSRVKTTAKNLIEMADGNWREPMREHVANMTQGLIDSGNAIKVAERAANDGELLDASVSAYKQFSTVRNLPTVMALVMHYGVPTYNAKEGRFVGRSAEEAKSFEEVFLPLRSLIAEGTNESYLRMWEEWAVAKRAFRLIRLDKARGTNREKLFDEAKVKGMLDWADNTTVNGLNLGEVFEQVNKNWQELNTQVLDMGEELGVITKADKDRFYENDYVPFWRELTKLESRGQPGGKGVNIESSGIKNLFGATDAEGNAKKLDGQIVESMFMNTANLIDRIYRNQAMKRIAELGVDQGMMTEISKQVKRQHVDIEELARHAKDAGFLSADTYDDAKAIIKTMKPAERKELETFYTRIKPVGDDIVTVFDRQPVIDPKTKQPKKDSKGKIIYDDKPKYYRVTDKMYLRSIKGLSQENMGGIMALLRGSKKVLTTGVTTDPAFMIANSIRDTVASWIVSDARVNPFKGFLTSAKEAYTVGPQMLDLMYAGRGGGQFYDTNPDQVRKLLKNFMPDKEIPHFLQTIVTPRTWWETWKKVGNASELLNRMTEVRARKEQGASDAEALWYAQDLLNFTRSGDFKAMQIILQSVPFMNARIQGLNRMVRGAKDNPQQFMLKGGGLAIASLMLALKNDDDDRYNDLPEWDKDAYFHFFIGDEHIRVPKPFEVGFIFGTLPERSLRLGVGDDQGDWKLFKERMLTNVLENLNFNPIPQAAKPLIEQFANKSMFTHSPIVGTGLASNKPEAQYDARTAEIAKVVAEAMPDSAPDWLRSPKRLEAMTRGYFAALGTYMLGMSSLMVDTVMDNPEKPAQRLSDRPVLRRFLRPEVPHSTKYDRLLWESLNEADEIANAIRKYRDEGLGRKALGLKRTERDKLVVRKRLRKLGAQVRDINARMERVRLSNASPESKRKRIDRLQEQKNKVTKRAGPLTEDF